MRRNTVLRTAAALLFVFVPATTLDADPGYCSIRGAGAKACYSEAGGCTVSAEYDAVRDITTWGIYCADGYASAGYIGGDETAGLCG